jgi:DNA modification methylase
VKISRWEGCYDSSWKGLITDASFAHPAKFARGLIERIYDHCLAQGYLHRGDLVADVFGGIGTGGITAAYRGLNWIGCELEPKFVALAQENFKLHRHGWSAVRGGSATIIQGDSRKFDEHVAGIVSSPPFVDSMSDKPSKQLLEGGGGRMGGSCKGDGYGESSGQIGSLKSGAVEAVIASPPFTQGYQSGGGINKNGYGKDGADKVGARTYQGQGGDRTAGNIETLKEGTVQAVVSSPPYSDSAPEKFGSGINTEKLWIRYREQGGGLSLEGFKAHKEKHSQGYGTTTGQISQLKGGSVDACVSSPPWESNSEGSRKSGKFKDPTAVLKCNRGHGASDAAVLAQAARDEQKVYGDSEGQIGKEAGETYWQAVDAVYRACFRCIRPGGVIVLVVKDYCSKGKRVRLCDDTMRLLEHIGFEPLERIHAMLVTETVENGLFGEEKTTKERKSFFRRIYEELAQAKHHWVSILDKARWLRVARKQEWKAYRECLAAGPAPHQKDDPALWPPKKPTKQDITTTAQKLAWKNDESPWAELETMIDHEEVIIARRP